MALRAGGISADDMKFLGMKEGGVCNTREPGRWPLLKLACRLDDVQHLIPMTADNMRVVSGKFDPYSRNIVAPDHLLAGIGKFLIKTLFQTLSDAAAQTKLDCMIRQDLVDLGLGRHSTLYNQTTKTLNSISMSCVFGILMVIVAEVRNLRTSHKSDILSLCNNFRELIALTFFWPLPGTDSIEAFEKVHGGNQNGYHASMIRLAETFVNEVNQSCTKYAEVMDNLDRPNLHRLIELYRHTIPNYSHALFCCDMSFERNHQPFKRSLLKNSSPSSHLSAVYQILGGDWFGRLSELVVHREISTTTESNSTINRSLRRLLFGEEVDHIVSVCSAADEIINELDKHAEDLLEPNFVNLLHKWYNSYMTGWGLGKWKGCIVTDRVMASGTPRFPPIINLSLERYTLCTENVLETATVQLQQFLTTLDIDEDVALYAEVHYEQTISTFSRRRYTQHKMKFGDFFEAFIPPNQFEMGTNILSPSTDGSGEHCTFQIQALLGYSSSNIWALSSKGNPSACHEHVYKFGLGPSSPLYLVQFTPFIRKSFSLHACHVDVHPGCSSTDNGKVVHNIGSQSNFYIFTREEGFPPRRS